MESNLIKDYNQTLSKTQYVSLMYSKTWDEWQPDFISFQNETIEEFRDRINPYYQRTKIPYRIIKKTTTTSYEFIVEIRN